jgi:hypothetical protein
VSFKPAGVVVILSDVWKHDKFTELEDAQQPTSTS